jgi:pyruvate dehydrogenase E2 component (dihydrolipoamide acetyltransferase)
VSSQVTLPRLGQGMESGTIVKWLKSEGDRVEKGEPLYELDTEKVTQEVEADVSGVVLKILAQEGQEIEVGKAVAVIGEEGEEVAEPEDKAEKEEVAEPKDEAGAPTKVTEEEPQEEGEPAPARDEERERGREAETKEPAKDVGAGQAPPAPTDGGRLKASPLARRIAKERGIDLKALQGTGPEGRIVAEDVERARAAPTPGVAAAPAPGEVEVVELNRMRQTIARRLTEAWQAPHFQIAMSADMRASVRLRETLVERTGEGGVRPTYSDILTKVCALALMRHRAINAHFVEGKVQIFPTANIGIAVAVPDGLIVPVIPNCEARTIPEIAAARADIVERARSGKLQTADLVNGTFTISNLGMYGVDRFIAVLNPPQVTILAVGAIEERAVAEDGQVVAQPRMELTLSCDHRAVDGAVASEFLADVKAFLEEPGLAL